VTRALGVAVFADDVIPTADGLPPIPSNLVAGDPCGHGHMDRSGRGIRYLANSTCVGCSRVTRARHDGRPDPEPDLDVIVATMYARERRHAAEAARKVAKSKRKSSLSRPTRGGGSASRLSNVVCAADGCSRRIVASAVSAGVAYCSRAHDPGVCWKLLNRTEQEEPLPRDEPCRWCGERCWERFREYGAIVNGTSSADDDADVSDAELAKVETVE
jgi:hypothetical protein